MRTITYTGFAVLLGLAGALTTWYLVARRGRQGLLVVPAVLVVIGAVGSVAAAVVAASNLALFSALYVVYLVGVVSVPVVGLGTLTAWWQRRPSGWLAGLGVVLLVPAVVGAYATHVAPYRLRADQASLSVPADRVGPEGLRVAVVADLQLSTVTDYEREALDRVMEADPDVIVLAGDFYQGPASELEREAGPYQDLLGRLSAPGGVYAVRGDVDGGIGEVDLLVEGTEVEILDDEVVRFSVGGTDVVLGGVGLDRSTETAAAVRAELQAAPAGELAILLSHRPDTVLDLPPDSRVDLVAAGHTHGGQIAIPGFGPITILSSVPRQVGAGGLHHVDGNAIYVSTGVGMERGGAPEVRLFTRPSYGIVDVAADGS